MPHWEHGYRTHGYWADANTRLGAVGIGPRGLWDGIYRWSVDKTGESGESDSLQKAKREVERRVLHNARLTAPLTNFKQYGDA